MDKDSVEKELLEAYKSLENAERRIKTLQIANKQNEMIIELLETAGFIKEGKLQEAREFVYTFKT